MSDRVVPLGSVGDVVMGQSPAGATCNRDGQGTPLLNGPTEFGHRSPSPAQWTTAPARFAQEGDTLFCVRGSTTGRMNIADQTYAIGRGVAAIRGKDPTDTTFLRAAIESGLPELLALTTGTVFPNISGSDLRQFNIPWPERDERRRVADLLEALDRSTSLARRTRATSLLTAQTLLQTAPSSCSISELATAKRSSFDPSRHSGEVIDHYSLPAFDSGAQPERVSAESIASNKLHITGPSVLVSKLNPATNRTWLVEPQSSVAWSVCSTEYVVLEPSGVTVHTLFAAVSPNDVGEVLAAGTTGTSASHQRVKVDEVLAATVPDPRSLDAAAALELQALIELYQAKSRQVASLLRFRSFVLRGLLQGDLAVDDAPALVGVAS